MNYYSTCCDYNYYKSCNYKSVLNSYNKNDLFNDDV